MEVVKVSPQPAVELAPGSPECRMVRHHQAGPSRHPPMAPPIQPHNDAIEIARPGQWA